MQTLRIVDRLAGLIERRRRVRADKSQRDGPSDRRRDLGATLVGTARLRCLRARRLHAERHRLSLGAHDRGGRGVDPAASLRGAERDRRSSAARSAPPPEPGSQRRRISSKPGTASCSSPATPTSRRSRVGGRLRELHVLRPDRMKVVPGADGWPEAYEYTAAGQHGALRRRGRARRARRSCTCVSFTRPTTTTA